MLCIDRGRHERLTSLEAVSIVARVCLSLPSTSISQKDNQRNIYSPIR